MYDSLVGNNDQMYDSIKHTILENVINGISDLYAIKTQAAQFRAQMGTNLTYVKYCTLVLAAAQAYDAQHATKANSRGTRRSIYNGELQYHIPDLHEYDLDNN